MMIPHFRLVPSEKESRSGSAGMMLGRLALGFSLVVTGAMVAPASAADYKFRFANVDAPQSIGGHGMEVFAECVAEKSDGRVAVETFPSGALGDQTDNMESLQAGLLDFTKVISPIVNVEPIAAVLTLPYVFRDREHVARVMNGAVGTWLADRLVGQGLRVLGYWEGGFRQITNNVRPINTPADLAGLKMRTPSDPTRILLFNELGANASALPWAEIYSALQTGVYDAQENPALYVEDANLFEVQKYLSFTSHVYGVSYLLMSEEKYADLPNDLKLVMHQCGRISADATVAYGIKADEEAADFARGKGMEVNQADVNSFVEATIPLREKMLELVLKPEDIPTAQMLLDAVSGAAEQ
jgi:tripartite ATP-independent transporter DctP family solute receptor